MLKKTLIASTLTLGLAVGSSGVQANPLTNFVSGLLNDVTSVQFDARRGGGMRRSSTPARATATRSSSTRATTRDNNTVNKSASQQQTAQQNRNTQQQQQPNATPQPAQQAGSLGMGGSFLSSLAGAGAGVLLANMLLSPSAAAAAQTEVATPDMLSDDQIKECLSQIDTDIKDAEAKLADAAPEEQGAIRDTISKMNELKITLMQEQINRLQKS